MKQTPYSEMYFITKLVRKNNVSVMCCNISQLVKFYKTTLMGVTKIWADVCVLCDNNSMLLG